jgi:glycosyltransferase involved in cell wall biosynthesis
MKGNHVLRKAGWDTHGLPVELEVEKKLGLESKTGIEGYGIEPFIMQCKESVWQYSNEWKKMSDRVGYWCDMDNPYVTYHDDYIESEWWALKEIHKKGLLYKGHKIVPILNGVDINVFKPLNKINIKEKYKIGNRFVLMGLATAWSERKGFNDYIELSKHIGDDEVIVLVGLKKEQFQKLPSNVIGIERTSNVQELVELYSIADIVLNLSYGETFGLTTVEGFACGIPGIVYDRTASPELIDEGVGYVVEAGNMKQLLNAINLIKQKGKAYYSENCRKRAECNYDKDRIFNEYIELYNNLLNNKK